MKFLIFKTLPRGYGKKVALSDKLLYDAKKMKATLSEIPVSNIYEDFFKSMIKAELENLVDVIKDFQTVINGEEVGFEDD